MKLIYPAVFRQTETGNYKGYFPDLECCYAEGETIDDAVENANAAAYDWIMVELDEEDPKLPPVTDIQDLELEDQDIVRHISISLKYTEGWEE